MIIKRSSTNDSCVINYKSWVRDLPTNETMADQNEQECGDELENECEH